MPGVSKQFSVKWPNLDDQWAAEGPLEAFRFSVFSTVHLRILFHKRTRKRNIRNRGNSLLILCPSELTESCVHFLLPGMLAFLFISRSRGVGFTRQEVRSLSSSSARLGSPISFCKCCAILCNVAHFGWIVFMLIHGTGLGRGRFCFVSYFLENIYHCACCRYSVILNKRIVTECELGNLCKGMTLFLSWLLALIRCILHLSVLDFS